MRKLFALLLLCVFFPLSAQEEADNVYRKPFAERIFIGGNVGFSFSNTGSFINVSPYVGYRITDEFSVGPGFIYQYNSYKNNVSGYKSSYSLYGGNFFARYIFMQYVILQATYEYINFPTAIYEYGSSIKDRSNEHYLYLGGGLQYPMSNNAWISILISYDVLDSPTKFNPHGRNPIYLVGFNFGI